MIGSRRHRNCARRFPGDSRSQ